MNMKLRIEDYFLDYLEDRLPDAKRRRVAAALAGSERLRTEYTEFTQILKLSRSAGEPTPQLDVDLSAAVLREIRDIEPQRQIGVLASLSVDRFWRENVLFVLGVCFAVLVSSLAIVTFVPGTNESQNLHFASDGTTGAPSAYAMRESYPVRYKEIRIGESLRRSVGLLDDLLSVIGLLLGLFAAGVSASLKRYGLACTFLALTGMLFVAVVILPVLAL
jgi:hypothetical protein